jgi:hypothetical protein
MASMRLQVAECGPNGQRRAKRGPFDKWPGRGFSAGPLTALTNSSAAGEGRETTTRAIGGTGARSAARALAKSGRLLPAIAQVRKAIYVSPLLGPQPRVSTW